jgi:hypothetical protein
MILRPVAAARRRFSTGILPDGVRTFLSKFQIRARRLGRALGSKNSERRSGPEAEIGKPANASAATQAARFSMRNFESQRREAAKIRVKKSDRKSRKHGRAKTLKGNHLCTSALQRFRDKKIFNSALISHTPATLRVRS